MYNDQLKNSFYGILSETKKKNADVTFELYNKEEERLNKKLENFSKDEVLEVARKISARTKCTLVLRVLKEFFAYAEHNGEGVNILKDFNITQFLDEVYIEKLISYVDHKQFLKDVKTLEKSDTGLYDIALLECLYYGIVFSTKELSDLKLSDIEIVDNTYYIKGKARNNSMIPIDLYDRLSKVNSLSVISSGVREYMLKRDKDRIFKPTVHSNASEAYLNDLIRKRISHNLGKKVNAKTYLRSGLLNFVIKESKKEGLDFYQDFKSDKRMLGTTVKYEKMFSDFGRDITMFYFRKIYRPIV